MYVNLLAKRKSELSSTELDTGEAEAPTDESSEDSASDGENSDTEVQSSTSSKRGTVMKVNFPLLSLSSAALKWR